MLQAYIVSKNRAAQCDLLLQSIERHFPDLFNIHIQFVATNGEYAKGYDLLASRWNVRLIEEENLKQDFVDAILLSESQFFCILTDDSLFYRSEEVTERDFVDLFALDAELLCFSFRLGLNTIVQDYSTGRLQSPLDNAQSFRQFKIWNWKERHPLENYGYPISMDGHMYLESDILGPTEELEFSNFRAWEGNYALDKRSRFEHKPLMASFNKSVLVNVPVNCVQDPPIPHGGKYPMSSEEMNERYINGEVLGLDAIQCGQVVGCHQELELKWKGL